MRRVKRLLSWLRSPTDDLRNRVLHSGVWNTLLNVTDRSLQIVRLVVLSRLLPPADFGLLGIALLTMEVLNRLANLGIDASLIQREEDDVTPYLDTVWVLKATRGVGLFVTLYAGAPFVSSFFAEPRIEPILRVFGFTAVLEGLVNPAIVYFKKDLDFRKQFGLRISGTVVDFVVAVGTAFALQNVWALVYGVLAGRATRLVVSYVLHGYRPSVVFDQGAVSDVMDFGKWMWATGLMVFVATYADDSFVGWYLGAASLGLYQMAFRLSNAPATEVTQVLSGVMFPAYSKLQSDRDALRNAFSKTVQVTLLVSVPMAAGIFLVARPFTEVALGANWLPMVPAMQIMAVAGLLRSVSVTGGAMFNGYGIPEWDFRMNAVRAVTVLLTVWPLTDSWGIQGTALSITLGIGLTVPIWLYKTASITGLSLSDYGRMFTTPTIATAIMCVPVSLAAGPGVIRLVISITLGILTYVGAVVVIHEYARVSSVDELLEELRSV